MHIQDLRELNLRAVSAQITLVAVCISMLGCAVVMPSPVATGTHRRALQSAELAPANVGEFSLAPGLPALMDSELSGGLRGGNIEAPGGSYSRHLRDTLKAELYSAGLLDTQSSYIIEGQLTENMLDAAISIGSARLAGRIQVIRDGQVAFDKAVVAEDTWDSSFAGAVAIPRAIEHYQALYGKFVNILLSDEDFLTALAK